MVRVALVTRFFPAVGALGDAAPVARMARELQAAGVQVEVFAVAPPIHPDDVAYGWAMVPTAAGLPVTRVAAGSVMPPAYVLWRALDDRGPFAAVLAFQPALTGTAAVTAARAWDVPCAVVVAAREAWQHGQDARTGPLLRWALSQARLVLADCPETRDVLRPIHPGPVLIRPPVLEGRRLPRTAVLEAEWGLPPAPLRIGLFGADDPGGGLETALVAFAAVARRRPQAQMVVVGRLAPQDDERVAAWCRAHPDAARGLLPVPEPAEEEWPALMGLLDQAWAPWRHGGCGEGGLQAIACGVPLVATPHGPHAESLPGNPMARMVREGDAAGLAAAAIELWGQVPSTGDPAVPSGDAALAERGRQLMQALRIQIEGR